MTKTREKYTVKRLTERDLLILKKLYKYRLLSTEQLMVIFGMSRLSVNNKMYIFRNSGYVLSYPLADDKGYRSGAYHRISETGIHCLRKQGMVVERSANGLRVNKYHVEYLLNAYDLAIELSPYGWDYDDSRDAKEKYRLNRQSGLHGLLTSPQGTESSLYIMLNDIYPRSLGKIIREIEYSRIHNHLILTRGQPSFNSITGGLLKQGVVVGGGIKVMPYRFGMNYLKISHTENHLVKFYTILGLSNISINTENKLFDYVVEHEGEEKYLVDLLDTDLMKIHKLSQYRKEHYEHDGRKVLLLSHMVEKHKEMLGKILHVEYLSVSPQVLNDYLRSVHPVRQNTF